VEPTTEGLLQGLGSAWLWGGSGTEQLESPGAFSPSALVVQGWGAARTLSCTRTANSWDLHICSPVFIGILQLI